MSHHCMHLKRVELPYPTSEGRPPGGARVHQDWHCYLTICGRGCLRNTWTAVCQYLSETKNFVKKLQMLASLPPPWTREG